MRMPKAHQTDRLDKQRPGSEEAFDGETAQDDLSARQHSRKPPCSAPLS